MKSPYSISLLRGMVRLSIQTKKLWLLPLLLILWLAGPVISACAGKRDAS
jgi:hypothetical protein